MDTAGRHHDISIHEGFPKDCKIHPRCCKPVTHKLSGDRPFWRCSVGQMTKIKKLSLAPFWIGIAGATNHVTGPLFGRRFGASIAAALRGSKIKCQFTKLVYLLLQSIWIQQRKQRDITMLQRCSRRNPHPQNRRSSSAMSVCSWVRLCRPEKYESGSTGENEMWITCCSTPWPPWEGPKNEKGHLPGKQWNPVETTKTTTGKYRKARHCGIPSSFCHVTNLWLAWFFRH